MTEAPFRAAAREQDTGPPPYRRNRPAPQKTEAEPCFRFGVWRFGSEYGIFGNGRIQAWADSRPQYRDKTWDYNIDENKHRDGVYYYFTNCPLNNFARKYGYMEILPVCCDLDYLITEANHGILHREQTLAAGGTMCDYWVVPDKISAPR